MEKKSLEELTAQDSGFYARFLIGRVRISSVSYISPSGVDSVYSAKPWA
jgi:hypothetical protein